MRPKANVSQYFLGRNPSGGAVYNISMTVKTDGAVLLNNFASSNAATFTQGYCTIAYIVD